jgi:diacylglycerol kinase (ATP)
MSKAKSLVIANPMTGRYGSRMSPSIESACELLKSHGVDVELVTTKAPGDAARIAAEAATAGVHQVIAAGGDGTINEAVQGLVGSKTRLAILPRGTANVLARELGIPFDARSAIEVIARAKTRQVHVGIATSETDQTQRYFLLMAGIGLDADVVRKVRPALKRRLGKGAFWVTGLSQLANWHPEIFKMEVDGQTYDATFVNVGNAPSYGGDLAITPGASLDQAEFEICIIQTANRFRYLGLLSAAMRRSGLQPNRKGVCFVRATRARATGNVPVQVDGEVIGLLPMTFEIAPHSLEIVVP